MSQRTHCPCLAPAAAAYYLHTKVGRYTADLLTRFDFSYDRVTKSIDESLERLGVDYIDTIQGES